MEKIKKANKIVDDRGGFLTRIKVKGYKSLFRPSEIEIRPLTILAGANNSGKSSIMQPLLLLKQTLEATYDPGGIKLDGPNVESISSEQIFSRPTIKSLSPELLIELTSEHDINGREKISFIFTENASRKVDIDRMTFQSPTDSITIYSQHAKNGDLFTKAASKANMGTNDVAYWDLDRFLLGGDFSFTSRDGKKADVQLRYGGKFRTILTQVIHVPGARRTPSRDYPTASLSTPTFKGLFTFYFAQLIETWQKSNSVLLGRLNELLAELKLASEVQARMVNGAHIELNVIIGPKKSKKKKLAARNLADVGFGVSQVLPVLTALLVAEPGQLVYLEEPELHLHPRAQVAMASILAAAAQRGVRVVAETHSSLLLLAIQTLVAEKKLDPELVKLHWFSLGRDGSTKIVSADLDEKGAFGDWPEDFGEVELKAESRYLDAVEGKKK